MTWSSWTFMPSYLWNDDYFWVVVSDHDISAKIYRYNILVLAIKCSLTYSFGKEEEASRQVEKLRSLGLEFEILEGEVRGRQGGLTRVKIPAIESKLVKPVTVAKSSREAMLKMLKK